MQFFGHAWPAIAAKAQTMLVADILFSARIAAREQRLDMPPNPPVTNFQL